MPKELNNAFLEDVSVGWCPTVEIQLPFKRRTKNKLAYLATFNVTNGLICTIWAIIQKDSEYVKFSNALPNTLYFPVYMGSKNLKLFGEPFYLKIDSGGKKQYIFFNKNEKNIDSVYITRKYPMKPKMLQRAKNLVGTVVVGSDNEAFENPDTLFTLSYIPSLYFQDMLLQNDKAYRYYKIEAPEKKPYMNITEVEYLTYKKYQYPNTTIPKPISIFNYSDIRKAYNSEYVKILDTCINSNHAEYDGNEQTAPFGAKNIILKLSNPIVIKAIRFVPMNAHNGVYAGNLYALYAWENDNWSLIEEKRGEYNFLPFYNLESNRLYWLKNKTEGREELPFILDNEGRQKFIYFDIK